MERHLNGDGCWKLLPFLTTNNHNEDEHWLMIRPCYLTNGGSLNILHVISCIWIFKGRWYKSNTNHDTIQWLDYNSTNHPYWCVLFVSYGGMIPTLIDSWWFQPPFQTTMNLWWPKTSTRPEKNTILWQPKSSERSLNGLDVLGSHNPFGRWQYGGNTTTKHMKFNICPEKLFLSSKESSGPTNVFQVASC